MDLVCDERPSDSPIVERIWHSRSESADPFISMADHHFAIVVTKLRDKTILTVRGPETRATPATGLADAEFFGIQFKATAPVDRAAKITVPALVMDGGANLAFMPFMHNTTTALAKAIPHAQHRTLEGQTHDVNLEVLASMLVEFFAQ